MPEQYPMSELVFYFFLYAFLGWVVYVVSMAVINRKFINYGFLNVPFAVPSGITMVILLLALPTMEGHTVWQYLSAWLILNMVDVLTGQFVRNVSRRSTMGKQDTGKISFRAEMLLNLVEALIYVSLYLVIHPFVYLLLSFVPRWLLLTADMVLIILLLVDFASVLYTLRTRRVTQGTEVIEERTRRMASRMTERIWRRLERAYPGVKRLEPETQSRYIFAKGICFDKLVWVFLISSFLGALIEMVYCRALGDPWMNRSSVLYGAFSFVWGFGAVVLTVVLQRLVGKEDWKVFLAGFFVGGVYEYLCSVFTELVFGTVFWDYSEMPLNIGGRTNVVYCIFWGILAVVWIKVLYPPMNRFIEKIPPLTGKIITWVIVFVMLCNGLLTAGAMVRYTQRQTQPEPANLLEEFLDVRYDDDRMESRWPNMKITEP